MGLDKMDSKKITRDKYTTTNQKIEKKKKKNSGRIIIMG